jgi:malonyl CoA-acyl carrier protein transacylase
VIHEVGPGKVLTGLARRIVEGVEVTPVGDREAVAAL